ncbi:Hypothetical_protein [Hexamita inflata]|uniref:Hypothetical_protein n=1 Tax=Hexamita inflata TaxID=28002 RepID=A0AA86Q737_9EUKA|nr:Hypothetical protein HINF_LOCUS41165 [Hexamita inflata]
MEFISKIASFSDKNSLSIFHIQRKLNSASKLLNTPLDRKQLISTKSNIHRSIPKELLNADGEFKSMVSAFIYEFPDQVFDDEDEYRRVSLEQFNKSQYQDYEIQFTDLPEE